MKRNTKFSFLVLVFVTVFLLLGSALGDEKSSELLPMTEGPTRQTDEEPLAGRQILVRIYNDWQTNPRAYKIISVPLSAHSVSFDAVRQAFAGIRD